MSVTNLTIDDFDPIIAYSDYTQWLTPNPQDNPTWYNQSESVTGLPWHEATYHYTTTKGAKASFNFTGSSLTIYGSPSPSSIQSSSNYTITIDQGISLNPFTKHFGESNQTGGNRIVLYTTDGLVYGNHQVEIVNFGEGVLVDLVQVGFEVGGSGATLSNMTIDDPDSTITYSGSWTTNNDTNFHGGTSIYTATPGDSMSFNFTGSTIYLYGDQVNDHGPYSVYLNDSSIPSATLTGRSGCNGTDGIKFCEKIGGLHFEANNLPFGTHQLKLVNGGNPGNISYFDFDYAVYTTPSTYSTLVLTSNSTCPFTDCSYLSAGGSGGSGGTSGTVTATAGGTTATTKTGAAGSVYDVHQGLLGLLLVVWGLWMVFTR